MTTASERTSSVIQTRDFLRELQRMPRVLKSVRAEARRLLRHYPSPGELDLTHHAAPEWWGPVPWPSGLPRADDVQGPIDSTSEQD